MTMVVETRAYLAAAADAGMSVEEREAVVSIIAANRMAGDFIPGTGGALKLELKKPGAGRSGAYKVISYYPGENYPAFLLTVLGKNERAILTGSERNALAQLTKRLAEKLRTRK